MRDIVFELRNIVAEVAPEATESIHSKGLSYFIESRGGPVSAGVCQIVIEKDHIRLAFIHGAFLPDRLNLLEGAPSYKKYIRIASFEHAPWDYLKEMIAASYRFDPREPGATSKLYKPPLK
ncbi:MAG: DUF1801 domain-containing protein [Anaerolineaceae bacterium]|nr:DUF1801 domain-containing protein [Anaerolineaceae bacterium]